MKELKTDNEIVIKPADKGSGTVIWGMDAYISEVHSQLNTAFYRHSSDTEYKDILEKINRTLSDLQRNQRITQQAKKKMSQTEPRPAEFYLLPEIH